MEIIGTMIYLEEKLRIFLLVVELSVYFNFFAFQNYHVPKSVIPVLLGRETTS